ncbi:phosphotransferase, partial [Nocardioides kribbensis]|uniref:phosphotransferase n=1 Tax=Nocardioides kribbensis TaxID=305517 RepID=UPI0032DB7A5C
MTVPPYEHAPGPASEHAGAPGGLAAGLRPLEGGYSGETFLAETGGERSVVRIYAGGRGPAAPSVDAAVLRLARGTVPVPQVLEVRHGDPDPHGEPGRLAEHTQHAAEVARHLPRQARGPARRRSTR